MDPLAHTLFGASIAELGLRRVTPLATATLVLGANLPDVDAITYFFPSDVAQGFRRGWTHGVLAMAVLPWALAGVVLLFDRLVRRRLAPDAPPARPGPILALAYLGVLTHPALDWLNTYGVRLLMPFDGTWFYGDALFIVDPYLWLLLAAPVILARTNEKVSLAAFLVLATATVAFVVESDRAPAFVKPVFAISVAAIFALRLAGFARGHLERFARATFATGAVYIVSMIIASNVAEAEARRYLEARSIVVKELVASPSPANPFRRSIVAAVDGGYRTVELDWLSGGGPRDGGAFIPSAPSEDPVVAAARTADGARGLVTWLRFPVYEVEELEDGWRVGIGDARRIGRGRSLVRRVVRLDANLRPLGVESPD
ncbi:metal-dependent hydrolase [Myxococcota bacterium]|nr:metal-dependent hydrolase [Myxococcota bacterium]